MDEELTITNHYAFQTVERVDERRFLTDRGKKRLRYWQEKDAFNWQMEMRNFCEEPSSLFMNRMIQTKEGTGGFHSGDGWYSLHDDVPEKGYRQKGEEEKWGRLLGRMLSFGCKQEYASMGSYNLQENNEVILPDNIEVHPFLKHVKAEVQKRNKFAERLTKEVSQEVPPLLENQLSLSNGREIFGRLVWCSEEMPVRGYEPLKGLFLQWERAHGTLSLEALLNAIQSHFDLTKGQGVLLLATLLRPHECQLLVRTREQDNVEPFLREWDEAQRLVQTFSKWLDERKQKGGQCDSSSSRNGSHSLSV